MNYREIFLDWITNESQSRSGSMLPPDRLLAKQFGVTARTIARWMRTASERKLVTRVPGQGSYAGEKILSPVVIDRPQNGSASEIFAQRLRDSISGGDIRSGRSLPAVKYLCRTYEVSPLTVRRACLQMESAGLITRYGRLWRVVSPRILSGTHSGSDVLIVSNERDLPGMFVDEMLSLSYRHMEQELLTFGYCLRFAAFEELESIEKVLTKATTLRAILFHKVTEERMPCILDFVNRIHRSSCGAQQIAILVDRWTGFVPPNAHVNTILNRATILKSFAREFVRFVVVKGYRRVLFFITEGTVIWNHFSPSHIYAAIRSEMRKTVPEVARRVLMHSKADRTDQAGIAEILWRQMREFTIEHDRYAGSKEELFRELAVWSGFDRCVDKGEEGVLWVFPHDLAAMDALEWLRNHNFAVPRKIAVVGLEEKPEFIHRGLSSFAPDWSGIGYLLAHAVMRDIPVAKNKKRFIETRAVAIDRASTNSSHFDHIRILK